MSKIGNINITNNADVVVIDIEGVIGVPEYWQFEEPGDRVATYEKFRDIVAQIKDIKASDVVVNIRSTGGNVNDALLIYDALGELNATITTKCYGYVASAATIIAQAASDGKRRISENSLYLIHKAMAVADGNAEEIERTVDMLRKTDERIAAIYSARGGKEDQFYLDLMGENNGNGKWLDASETIEMGLVDEVIKSTSPINMSVDTVKSLGLPEIPQNKLKIINKTEKMKVNTMWEFIINFFGFDKEKDNELTEAQIGKLNNELTSKTTEVTNLKKDVADLKTEKENKEAEVLNLATTLTERNTTIETLNARILSLEEENEKLKPKPTETKQHNDPDPTNHEMCGREKAYQNDVNALK